MILSKKDFVNFVIKLFIVAKTAKTEKQLYAHMGKRITDLRKKAGYSSQENFAYDADIPRALYGRYEKGANLTIGSLHRILNHHNITFKEFFAEGFEEM